MSYIAPMDQWKIICWLGTELGHSKAAVKKWRQRRRVPFYLRTTIHEAAVKRGWRLKPSDFGKGYRE